MKVSEAEYREMLVLMAKQLDLWVEESIRGGWSTHQVEPMEQRAQEIYAFLGRTS